MTLTDAAYLDFADDLRICRILNGMWQVSGAHGDIPHDAAIREMINYHNEGFTTWDLADHYGPAEDFIGRFRDALGKQGGNPGTSQAFTKWVPRPGRMTSDVVEQAVRTSRERMGVDAIDLLQFHWWEYRDSGYLSALNHLSFLVTTGQIRYLGLTNFDTRHLKNIMENGIRIHANQVQYSIIDQRPAVQMASYCNANDVWLLAYGTLAGGFLTDRFLDQPEPTAADLNTASLRKYKGMIDKWGGWALFQNLLRAMRQVADKHGVTIANVAVRFVLQQTAVAGAIVGTRLGVTEHRADTQRVFGFTLDDSDMEELRAATQNANDLFKAIGDCGAEYRR